MGLQFTVDWFTCYIPLWEKHLSVFKGKPFLHFLEIGSFEGRSACWLLQNILTHDSCSLTCIDLFPAEKQFDENMRHIGATAKVTKLKGYSQDVLPTLLSYSFHFVYIDGDHSAFTVIADAVLSWRLLRADGMLVFDDYKWQLGYCQPPFGTPKLAIDSFLQAYDGKYDMVHKGQQVILCKANN